MSGAAVIVNSNGQLGVASSSIKYKEDVQDLGDDTDSALMRLRPVSFRYKGTTPVQYGLIAEEVDQVIPSLVARDSKGDPMSVQYHELPALLLSEIQRQQRTMEDQSKQLMTSANWCNAWRSACQIWKHDRRRRWNPSASAASQCATNESNIAAPVTLTLHQSP